MRPANVEGEARLQRVVMLYIVTGLFFMLLPGTFLGVWNLISISNRHALESLSPAWLQAHGHAQIFGWIGTFVLGVGFYSLSKTATTRAAVAQRAWVCYGLWTAGVILRWLANVTEWEWRITLPLSAFLELAGFLTFFVTVARHRPEAGTTPKMEPWMLIVIASTFGFLIALLANVAATCDAAFRATGPAISHVLDQRLLVLPAWGFLVPAVWGFNARWLPVFLGLPRANGRRLFVALGVVWIALGAALNGHALFSAILLLAAAIVSALALHVFEPGIQAPKTNGVHPSFPVFVRASYVWLIVAAMLTVWAAAADRSGGIWGASRHALTVGFLAAMVFAIGQKVLPAFCGARLLFSKNLMFASLLLLNVGCALRVGSEIPAYEGYAQQAWQVLPISAITELTAVTLFAANLLFTFVRRPAHMMREQTITSAR